MKTVKVILFLICVPLLLTTCKKPSKEPAGAKGTLNVQFNPTVGNQALSFTNAIYSFPNISQYIYFSDLQLYVSNFSLVKSDNTLVQIDSAIYFQFGDATYMSFSADSVPAGVYKGIQLSFGLDHTENSVNPYSFPAGNALSGVDKNDIYWSWMKYRFMSLEGRLDTSATDSFVHGVGLDYHIGTDTCYRVIPLSGGAITVTAGASTTINLNLDIMKIFYNSSDLNSSDSLNMFLYPGSQSVDTFPGNDIAVALHFSNQITHAFSYSQQ